MDSRGGLMAGRTPWAPAPDPAAPSTHPAPTMHFVRQEHRVKHSARVDSLVAAPKVQLIGCRLLKGTRLLFAVTPTQAPALMKGKKRQSLWALPLLLLDQVKI